MLFVCAIVLVYKQGTGDYKMTSLAININSIKRAMIKDEVYSDTNAYGNYKITFGAFGRQITVKCTALTQPTVEQLEDGDFPVRYTAPMDPDFNTTDYDEMFDFVADVFLSYYQD